MRRISAVFLASIFLLAGCRTYGGSGSEEATRAEIASAVSRLDDDLARLSADAMVFDEAAASVPALSAFAPDMKQLADDGSRLLAAHREHGERAVDMGDYRALHILLGSMVTEQQMLRNRYQELLRDVAGVEHEASSHYVLAPVFYARIQASLRTLVLRDVLTRS